MVWSFGGDSLLNCKNTFKEKKRNIKEEKAQGFLLIQFFTVAYICYILWKN